MAVDPVTECAQRVCAANNFKMAGRCNAGAFKHTFHVSSGNDQLALKLVVGVIDHARVQREVDALRACNHENISRLVAVGRTDLGGRQITSFVEAFLEGGTLGERLRRGLLSVQAARSFASTLWRALNYLARRSSVPGGLNPDTV